MKNFENLEHLWRRQTVVVRGDPQKIRAIQTSAERLVKSRGRLLRWGVAIALFSIFVSQLLTVVNFMHGGRTPTFVQLVHLGVLEVFQIGLLIGLLRRIRTHRQLRAKSAASVRNHAQASLELIEGEMRDYRIAGRIGVLLLVLDMIPVLDNFRSGYFDGAGLAYRLITLLLFGLLFGAVGFRHYWRVLHPQKQQLTQMLGELDAP